MRLTLSEAEQKLTLNEALQREGLYKVNEEPWNKVIVLLRRDGSEKPVYFGIDKDGNPYNFNPRWSGELVKIGSIKDANIELELE